MVIRKTTHGELVNLDLCYSYGHRENKVWHARNICLLNWLSRISLACFSEGLSNLKQIWLMVGLWMFINRRRSSVCNRVEWLGPIGHAFGHWPFSGNFLKPSIGFYEHFLQIRIIFALPALWSKFIYLPTKYQCLHFSTISVLYLEVKHQLCRNSWKSRVYQITQDLSTLRLGITILLLFLVLTSLEPDSCEIWLHILEVQPLNARACNLLVS